MSKKILEKCFNACIRFTYGISRFDWISDYAHTLFTHSEYLTSSFLHKVIVTKKPDYVFENLNFGSSNRLHNLILPRNCKNIVNDSFYVRGVSKYNALPAAVKAKYSLTGFKRACKEQLGLNVPANVLINNLISFILHFFIHPLTQSGSEHVHRVVRSDRRISMFLNWPLIFNF